MRKLGTRSAKPKDGGFLPASDDGQEVWFKREWRLIALLAIMIVAFVIRFIFAYGVSAGSDFALSGGTGASSHAHIMESILNGSFAFTDSALNYPYGSGVIYPPLMDILLSGVAGIVSAFGVSTGTAVAGTLAYSSPIFAALTCWPVYLIGRKMFDDEKIGLLAALLYAFFALMVMTSVFSNGTEYAFAGFLFAFMVYFLLKVLDDCDRIQPSGFRAMIKDRSVFWNLLIAGILFAMIALSWNQFRMILLVLVFIMAAQAVVDRIRSRPVSPTVGIYSAVILMGMLISAPYYILAGLWDLVFSGPFITAIMSVALAALFAKTTGKTWVLMIPAIFIIAAAVLVVMYFFAGDLFSAVIGGNSVYTNELTANLASVASRTSISSMAAFFGWVTLWLPFVMFLYMLYKYRGKMDSRKYTFTMWWIILMFCVGWYSVSNAALAGAGFAVASSAMILMIIRFAALKSYFADMRGNGIKHALRKALKPIPLATVIALVALVAAPNIIYSVDASIPTNSEGDGYLGGLGYTIMTDDVNSVNRMWNEFNDIDKDGALVAWFGHSTDAVSGGGFDSVTDALGGGSSAMSAILLANSGSAVTAAMAIRLMLANNISSFESAIKNAGLNFNIIKGYVDKPSTAVEEVRNNVEIYAGVDQKVTEENALYMVLINYITSTIPEPRVNDLYNNICNISGNSIRYVSVDRAMLPVYYGDNSYFMTAAYLGSYSLDRYGAPSKFFSYDGYSGYATYTDEMYSTFFWKALIGMSPAEAGYSSSVNYLNALALSDGKVKANPGYGLPNYKVAYWHVFYNPDSNATGSSDGWVDMNAFEAIKLQNKEGGMINFVNGVVMLEYDPSLTTEVSGKVTYVSDSGSAGAEGIQVSVFEKIDFDATGMTGYVKKSTVFTNDEGMYTICVPVGTEYYVVFSSGTDTLATGSIIETRWNMTSSSAGLNIPATSLSGSVYVNSDPLKLYTEKSYVSMEGTASGKSYQAEVVGGSFVFNNIIPDVYKLTVFSPTGTTINVGNVTVNIGANTGYRISATSGTINVTVTTDVGGKAPNGTVITAQDRSTGAVYTGIVDDGQASIFVVPSTYTVYATGGKVSVSNPTSTVSSGGSSSASLVVYDSKNITVTGAPAGGLVSIMSFGFITSSSTSYTFAVPTGGGGNNTYTAYATSGSSVYYGVTAGGSISLTSSAGYSVKGTVKDSDGAPFSGKVSFIMASGAAFIFTSDEDGKFDVMLPAATYTMYIYGTGGALISTQAVSGHTDLGEIKLSKSRELSVTLSYRTNMSSPTSRGIAFVDVKMAMTIDAEYFITVMTDTSGKATFIVPQGYAATITSPGFDTARFHVEAQSSNLAAGTSTTSDTWSVAASGTTGSYVKTVNVTNTVSVKLTLYNSSSTTYEGTNLTNVIPGQYTAQIRGNPNFYYNGTIYIYPGQSGSLNISATNVVKVDLIASTTDEITVTPTDDERGTFFVDPDNSHAYYLQKGKSFYFTATSGTGDTEQIAYASVSNISSPVTLNLSNKADKAEIKGFTGVNADGTLTVTYGSVTIPFPITDGAFDIILPAGIGPMTLNAKLSQKMNNMEYSYAGSVTMAASEVVDGATIRFPATTTAATDTLTELSGSGFSFIDGVGSFTLTLKNTGSYNTTFIVTAGSAWVLDKAYTISVDEGKTGTIKIDGRYDPAAVGAGNEDLSVTVTSINGTVLGTYVVDGSAFPTSGSTVTTTDTYVDISGTDGAAADAVSGNEYMYAVTITNKDSYLKTVSVTATISGGSGNWWIVYSDKDEGWIFSKEATNKFNVSGFGSTVIYIKLMCKDSSDIEVPTIDVKVTMPGQTLVTNSAGVIVSGSTATFSMSAKPAVMEAEEMTAKGNNIFDGPSPIPPTTMVLTALVILAFIAMMWLGMKKGVLVRKR
ncbi:MAG: hypothetical protein FWG60_03790 [Methanomassiliicoccaceae archaeon]|nr:hypothetical protein [Methanomassiliicoccaceae archaeon]